MQRNIFWTSLGFALGVAVGLNAQVAWAQTASASTPTVLPFTLAEAQRSLDDLTGRITGQRDSGRIRIERVLACYPAHRSAPTVRVCGMQLRSATGGTQMGVIALQKTLQGWNALAENIAAACASTDVVQAALRQYLQRDSVQVLQHLMEGRGEFTNLRGQHGDTFGPWRLRCSYAVAMEPGTEIMLVMYLGFNGRQFTLDHDFERWY